MGAGSPAPPDSDCITTRRASTPGSSCTDTGAASQTAFIFLYLINANRLLNGINADDFPGRRYLDGLARTFLESRSLHFWFNRHTYPDDNSDTDIHIYRHKHDYRNCYKDAAANSYIHANTDEYTKANPNADP